VNKKDLILGSVVALISLLYIRQTYELPAGEHFLNSSRSFPLLLGFTLLLLSTFIIVNGIRKRGDEQIKPLGRRGIQRGLYYIILTGVYIFVSIPVIGFVFSTLIYIIAGIIYYKEVKWYSSVIVSLGTLLVIYYVFNQWLLIGFP